MLVFVSIFTEAAGGPDSDDLSSFISGTGGKQNRRCLNQDPRDNRVSGSNFENVAPLEFLEKGSRIHWLAVMPNCLGVGKHRR
jgi:hypothetical protein